MFSIRNNSLEVSILDPVEDHALLGTRYCTGGYIFQVTDSVQGALLSGPTYPDSFNTYDGQGIPDAFNRAPLTTAGEQDVLIPGIGLCDLEKDKVSEKCTWSVTQEDFLIRFSTHHIFGEHNLTVERKVSLSGRTIRSATTVSNSGNTSIPIRWFPHPFFPQPETVELCRFNAPVFLPDNEGYGFARSGFICRRGKTWNRDYYQAVNHEAHSNLYVLQRHPKLGLVAGACSYIPTFLPIWGNERTFSWEPYMECTIAVGQEKHWHIDYIF
jgi:hypothetical protein